MCATGSKTGHIGKICLFFILFVCIWHEDSVVSMSTFDHRDNFSSSIDWQCQKRRKHCAIGSKVKNTVKFYKISVGNHRHENISGHGNQSDISPIL